MSATVRRGLGITAGLDAGLAREVAARCELLGYDSVWSNEEPVARGHDTVAQLAVATDAVDLGVGVLPLHRYDAEEIAAEVRRLGIDPREAVARDRIRCTASTGQRGAARGGRASQGADGADSHHGGRDAAPGSAASVARSPMASS